MRAKQVIPCIPTLGYGFRGFIISFVSIIYIQCLEFTDDYSISFSLVLSDSKFSCTLVYSECLVSIWQVEFFIEAIWLR